MFLEIIGMDVQVHAGETMAFELNPEFEHAALLLNGDCRFENQSLQERILYYLGSRRTSITLSSQAGGRLLLIGGLPFPETILMWWNFVARTPEEIAQARADWESLRKAPSRQDAGSRFGDVPGNHEAMLAPPNLTS